MQGRRESVPPRVKSRHKSPGQLGIGALFQADRPEGAGRGDGFTGHSDRAGMAQNLVKNGVELPALMTAGRWKSASKCDESLPEFARKGTKGKDRHRQGQPRLEVVIIT